MADMNGKVALVTGASSGIGAATAEAFAVRGASVVLAARRENELLALARTIEAGGGRAGYVRADVSVAAPPPARERCLRSGRCPCHGLPRHHAEGPLEISMW